jgi:hypothetical protein
MSQGRGEILHTALAIRPHPSDYADHLFGDGTHRSANSDAGNRPYRGISEPDAGHRAQRRHARRNCPAVRRAARDRCRTFRNLAHDVEYRGRALASEATRG